MCNLFFSWPLCLSFLDLRILTTSLVSSNSSYETHVREEVIKNGHSKDTGNTEHKNFLVHSLVIRIKGNIYVDHEAEDALAGPITFFLFKPCLFVDITVLHRICTKPSFFSVVF